MKNVVPSIGVKCHSAAADCGNVRASRTLAASALERRTGTYVTSLRKSVAKSERVTLPDDN